MLSEVMNVVVEIEKENERLCITDMIKEQVNHKKSITLTFTQREQDKV